MSLRAMAVSGLAVAGLLLTVPAAQAATPVQLTGAQLASRLLPPSSFPSGYKIAKSGTYNSGRRLEHGPVKHHLATFSCKTYIVKGLPRTGFGETATAASVVASGSGLPAGGLPVRQHQAGNRVLPAAVRVHRARAARSPPPSTAPCG